jgi:hypothetical protein
MVFDLRRISLMEGNHSWTFHGIVIEPLRRDEEFVLNRGEYPNLPDTPSVRLLAADSTWPAMETFASRSWAERAPIIF